MSISKEWKRSKVVTEMDALAKRGRDRLFIMAEVLDIAQRGGALKTQIMYRANLSYTQTIEMLSLLLDLNLLEMVPKGGKKTYKTTEKGLRYLESYREILRLLYKSGMKHKYVSQLHMMSSALGELKKAIDDTEASIMNMTKCINCEIEIFADFRFCPYCGKNQVRQTTGVAE